LRLRIPLRINRQPHFAAVLAHDHCEISHREHERYRGATLTPKGERVALEVIRHHRLLEQYLSQTLGLPIDELHTEADRLEHALSEELEAHIDRTLGFPTHDPHGDPIPGPDLKLSRMVTAPLSTLEPGDRAVVSRVPDSDGELLRYLAELKKGPDMLNYRRYSLAKIPETLRRFATPYIQPGADPQVVVLAHRRARILSQLPGTAGHPPPSTPGSQRHPPRTRHRCGGKDRFRRGGRGV